MTQRPREMGPHMKLARQHLLAAIKAHEDECHGGEVCDTERLNALAWLCHSLGLKATEAPKLMPFIFDADVRCEGGICTVHPK